MIARQLRLRDMGGQVVIDFIEMKDAKHCREVEKIMRAALKNDRARTDVSRISRFGLMELVRQRLGSSAIAVSTEPCPACHGTGIRRNMEWQSLQALRSIYRSLHKPNQTAPVVHECDGELAFYLLNHKRDMLKNLEKRFSTAIHIKTKNEEC